MTTSQKPDAASATMRAVKALKDMKAKLAEVQYRKREPIAIVGLACRFPGAPDPEHFWNLLNEGRDAIVPISADRFDVDAWFDSNPQAAGKSYVREAGLLDQIDGFDPDLFGISPREAASMDPQQRLALEVSWEALERAGIAADQLADTRTGVYLGLMTGDYERVGTQFDASEYDPYTAPGIGLSFPAGRISYALGSQGPSMVVATACSSSLVTVHLAAQALRAGECELALAGGVNVMLVPDLFVMLSRMQALAPDGRSKSFDASANGYGRGEGCGMVVLKRLSDAQADGDNILALVQGSAVGHNGASGGITVPRGLSQALLINEALEQGQVKPDQVDYVEAHGSGTRLGDPIEAGALIDALCPGRKGQLLIGSVKTNIGHLEAASGIAGLIKVVLSLQHEAVPASLHFQNPNPDIAWDHLKVPTETMPWARSEEPRYAGVSSFGLSGVNAHVLIGEAPVSEPDPEREDRQHHLLTVSGYNEDALARQVGRVSGYLRSHPDAKLGDVAYTLNHGRAKLSHRLALVTDSMANACDQLEAFGEGKCPASVRQGKVIEGDARGIAFLFTGQGAQYVQMGKQLYQTNSVFKRALDLCDKHLRAHMEQPLLEVLFPADGDASPIDDTAYTQPTLFSISYALSKVWKSLGLKPDWLMGHSVGEYVAAQMAGVFSLEDALKLIARRGALMQSLPRGGAMVALQTDEETVREAIRGKENRLAVAAVNGPRAVVLSGIEVAAREVVAELEEKGVKATWLQVSHAFHSPLMDPILDAFREVASEVKFKAPRRGMISNLTGDLAGDEVATAEYWVRHLREAVRFADGVDVLAQNGCRIFVELGPKPVLLGMARGFCSPDNALWLPSLRKGKPDWRVLLDSVAALHTRGLNMNLGQLDSGFRRHKLDLPTFDFNRRKLWYRAAKKQAANQTASMVKDISNPLLVQLPGVATENLDQPGKPLWLPTSDLVKDPALSQKLMDLARRYSVSPGMVSQVTGRAFVFVNTARTAFFFCNHRRHMLVAQVYSGAAEDFKALAAELMAFCASRSLEPNIIVESEEQRAALEELDFSSTIFGVWHNLENIAEFSLKGNKMRRLRYVVSRVPQAGEIAVEEYRLGSDATTDQDIVAIIDTWTNEKAKGSGPLTGYLKEAIQMGWPGSENRFFLIRLDGELKGVLLVIRLEAMNTFLMDVEFYGPDVPLGLMEYGIVEIIELLNREGHQNFSMGLTPVTQMHEHPNQDDGVRAFFAEVHEQGHLNGDANYQFKNKFRPTNLPVYLCRPKGLSSSHMTEFLMMMADPTNQNNPAVKAKTKTVATTENELHPLVHRKLDVATREKVYECHLSNTRPDWLADHQIGSFTLFPATGFIEMVLAAGRQEMDAPAIRDLEITAPLAIGEATYLQVLLEKKHNSWDFRVMSRGEDDWTCHVTGRLERAASAPAAMDLSEIVGRCPDSESGEALYHLFESMGYQYGPSFRGVQQWSYGANEVLANLGVTGLNRQDYRFHPALLDACLHACQGLIPVADRANATYLPFGCAGFTSWRDMPENATVHVLGHEVSDQTIRADLRICDAQGQVAAELSGLILKRASMAALMRALGEEQPQSLFLPRWRSVPHQAEQEQEARYLIFADQRGYADLFSSTLDVERTTLVYAGDAPDGAVSLDLEDSGPLAELLAELPQDLPLNILYMWDLDRPDLDAVSLNEHLLRQALRLQQLVLALDDSSRVGKIWLITDRTRFVPGHEHDEPAALGGLWGLGRVLANERPELWGGAIDLGGHDDLSAAQLLNAEFITPDGQSQIAWRGDSRLVPDLEEYPDTGSVGAAISRDGAYLITGGLGGLGLLVADRLVQQGAGEVVLVSRRQPDASQSTRIEAMKEKGSRVTTASLDITDGKAVRDLIGSINNLRGVFHAAGVIRDNLLAMQDRESFQSVLAPKVLGALHLDEATRDRELDYFVLFSSITSLLGTTGQSNYAMANDFMDSMAHLRRAQGKAGISINWGPWSGVGMAADLGERARANRLALGLDDLTPESGIEALDRILAGSEAQVVACRFNGASLASSPLAKLPILENLVARLAPRQSASSTVAAGPHATLSNLPEQDRLGGVGEYLVDKLASILDQAPGSLDRDEPLNNLGVDSLMVMELRNLLKGELDVDLPAVLFFDNPSLNALAEQVVALFVARPTGDTPSATPLSQILAAGPELRADSLKSYLVHILSEILERDPVSLNVDEPLNGMGLDSLMIMELRTRIKEDLNLDLPAVAFFDYPTISQMVHLIDEHLTSETPVTETPARNEEENSAAIDQMSDDEVNAMLAQMMSDQQQE